MILLPAIDILDGAVVRLVGGDFARAVVYDDDPVRVAGRWAEEGAEWIHVVDLDGARAGSPRHLGLLAAIARSVPARVQFGGGLRSMASLEHALDSGASRVVIGTAALADPEVLRSACARFEDRVAVALDVRDGVVRIAGWTESAGIGIEEAAGEVVRSGARRLVVTDVFADGAMTGPSLGLYRGLLRFGVPVVASGGVRSTVDLEALADVGVEGVIVGRALYEGAVRLSEAIGVGARRLPGVSPRDRS